MKNKILLYEYDNTKPNLLGKEWTDKVSMGSTLEQVIDETIPKYNITLVGTNKKERFTSGMKFIAKEVTFFNGEPIINDIDGEHHLVVYDDFCETVRMQNKTTYTHKITFEAASVIAQKLICDNFSLTHKLQDVSLDIPRTFNPYSLTPNNEINNTSHGSRYFVKPGDQEQIGSGTSKGLFRVYEYSYQFQHRWRWKNISERNEWDNLQRNRIPLSPNENSVTFTLPLPLYEIEGRNSNGNPVFVNARYQITVERVPANRLNQTPEIVQQFYVDRNDSEPNYPNERWTTDNMPFPNSGFNTEWLGGVPTSNQLFDQITGVEKVLTGGGLHRATRQYTRINDGGNTNSPRSITITMDTGGEQDEQGNYFGGQAYRYNIRMAFVPYDRFPITSTNSNWTIQLQDWLGGSVGYPLKYSWTSPSTISASAPKFETIKETNIGMFIYPYSEDKQIFTTSAEPYSIEQFINKAILSTRAYYSNQEIEFEIDPDALKDLQAVNTIETFFNEKNLWEIFIIAGNYIHSIPYLKFTPTSYNDTGEFIETLFMEIEKTNTDSITCKIPLDSRNFSNGLTSIIGLESKNFFSADDVNNLEYVLTPKYENGAIVFNILFDSELERDDWFLMHGNGNINAQFKIFFTGTRASNADKLQLCFRKIGHSIRSDIDKNGEKTIKANATRLSIFNSHTFENYISSVDSTITNLVQLGGIITEIVQPTSEDSDFLIYNGSVILKTSKPIIEIVKLEFSEKDNPSIKYDITDRILAEEIYNTLPIVPPMQTDADAYNKNYKGTFLFYKNGTNIIDGLTFQSPFNTGAIQIQSQGDFAIKKIIANAIYGIDNQGNWMHGGSLEKARKISINDYFFTIHYRTKDTLRAISYRTDLRKYLRHNKHERFPQLSQFNNQSDRFVDSARLGLHTYGVLIRTGNTTYRMNEWNSDFNQIKRAGELYMINNRLAYVSRVKHHIWQNHIISEVEYSIDYNQLSQIIGIPSEPRFYEISEQSSIDREVVFQDMIIIGTRKYQEKQDSPNPNSQSRLSAGGLIQLFKLMTVGGKYPQYALVFCKGQNFTDVFLMPFAAYSIMNNFVIEWDFEDNFSAGNMIKPPDVDFTNSGGDPLRLSQIINSITSVVDAEESDGAYQTLKPIRYCDENGRLELIEFYVLNEFSPINIPNNMETGLDENFHTGFQKLPSVTVYDNNENNLVLQSWIKEMLYRRSLPISGDNKTKLLGSFANSSISDIVDDAMYDNNGFKVMKDNREVIKCNYNISLITDSDRFIITNGLFQNYQDEELDENNNVILNARRKNIRIALLSVELNKFENGIISINDVITAEDGVIAGIPFMNLDNVEEKFSVDHNGITECRFDIEDTIFDNTTSEQRENTKSVVIYDADDQNTTKGKVKILIGRNVGDINAPIGIEPNNRPPAMTSDNADDMQYYKFSNWYLSWTPQEIFPQQDGREL